LKLIKSVTFLIILSFSVDNSLGVCNNTPKLITGETKCLDYFITYIEWRHDEVFNGEADKARLMTALELILYGYIVIIYLTTLTPNHQELLWRII